MDYYTKLPKLVRDKIDNYQRINQINSMADEMFEKCIKLVKKCTGDVLQVSGGNYHILMCNHCDITEEGIKKYCMKANVDQLYTNNEIYHCTICLDSRKNYCHQHVKGKLFKLKYDPTDSSKYEIRCQECLDPFDDSEDDTTSAQSPIIEEI
jgi:hypothetical protein